MTKFQKKKCLEAAEQKTSKLLVVVCCCKTVEFEKITENYKKSVNSSVSSIVIHPDLKFPGGSGPPGLLRYSAGSTVHHFLYSVI